MSDQTDDQLSRDLRERVIPLLREYLNTLTEIAKRAHELRLQQEKLNALAQKGVDADEAMSLQTRNIYLTKEISYLQELFKRINTPASQLAQYVSQRITHSAVEDLLKIELRLRLGEFEAALLNARRAVLA